MKTKPTRILTTLLAVMLCMAAFSISALAVDEKTATTSAVSTLDGTGTVVSDTTNGDGKEFLTITTSDNHVFYLIIDKQKTSDNVYFLDVVTTNDLLALAQSDGEGSETSSVSTAATSDPTSSPAVSTPVASETSQSEKQSGTAEITAVILLSAVIAGGAFWFFKFRKPKASSKDKKDPDEYDFLTDEDTEPEDEPEIPDEETEHEDE